MIVIANEKSRNVGNYNFVHVVPYFLMYNQEAGYLYASSSENNGITVGNVAMPLNNMVFKPISEHYFDCYQKEGAQRAKQYIERIMGVAARFKEDYESNSFRESDYVCKHISNFITECSSFILTSCSVNITKFVASSYSQVKRCELAHLSYNEFAKVANAKKGRSGRRKKSS